MHQSLPNSRFQRRASHILTGTLLLVASIAAAQDYDFEALYENHIFHTCSAAINNDGIAVYSYSTLDEYVTYAVLPDGAERLIAVLPTTRNVESGVAGNCGRLIERTGISDSGLVSVPIWMVEENRLIGTGVQIYDLEGVLLKTIFDESFFLQSAANSNGYVAGRVASRATVVTDGSTKDLYEPIPHGGHSARVLNENNAVAWTSVEGKDGDAPRSSYLQFGKTSRLSLTELGCMVNCGGRLVQGEGALFGSQNVPSLNDRDFASLATGSPTCPAGNAESTWNHRMLLLDPADQSFAPITQATPSGYLKSFAGSRTAINNFNRVLFNARYGPDACSLPGFGVYIGDGSGDSPRRVWDAETPVELNDGDVVRLTRSAFQIFPGSLNDSGEIVFHAGFSSTTSTRGGFAFFKATPREGLEPGTPILPDEFLPGGPGSGWRFGRNSRLTCTAFHVPDPATGDPVGEIAFKQGTCFFDPHIAVGYEFTMESERAAFRGVVVPDNPEVADTEFVVEYEGSSTTVIGIGKSPMNGILRCPLGKPCDDSDSLPGIGMQHAYARGLLDDTRAHIAGDVSAGHC